MYKIGDVVRLTITGRIQEVTENEYGKTIKILPEGEEILTSIVRNPETVEIIKEKEMKT